MFYKEMRRPKVGKTLFLFFFIGWLTVGLILPVAAQEQTATLKGLITDTEGFPLPGAFIYVDSPSMLDIKTYVTSETGRIKFHNLPPGTYKITVEMPGFKTVNIENIILRVGSTVRLHITMEITTIEEVTTVKIPSPTGNPESAKVAVIIEEDLIKRIPLERNLHHIITSVPGIIPDTIFFPKASLIHGSPARSNLYTMDNMVLSDPSGFHLMTNINTDLIEEIEVVTGGMSPQVGHINGGFVNVVTRSGGNETFGEALIYHTSKSLSSPLTSEEELSATEVSPAPLNKKLWDFSLAFGGPIMKDRLWFFTNARLLSQTRSTVFFPWTDPQEKEHEVYDWDNTEKMGFIKFTSQFVPNIKVTGMFNYVNRNRLFHGSNIDWNITADATQNMDHERTFQGTGIVNYIFDQNTFLDFKAGYLENKLPLLLQDDVKDNPRYIDASTGHVWGSARFNEIYKGKRFQGSAYITRFQDNILGLDHELEAGGEYEFAYSEWSVWKANNLTVHYNNGSPYFFGLNESPTTGNDVGTGRVSFLIVSKDEGRFNPKFEARRLSFIIQDKITFAERLTLKLGLRFDHSSMTHLALLKDISGNPVSLALGEQFILPQVDFNPFDTIQASGWKNIMVWNVFSPRLGLIFDVFGNGRSLFKASFSRYTEYMMLDYAAGLIPLSPMRSHMFFWYDENMDGAVDETDTFTPYLEDYRFYSPDFIDQRIASDTNSPYTDEFTIGLHQEIFPDFSFLLTYIYKNRKNILEDVLYDPDLGQDWYRISLDTEGWWTPFNTIIPGIDDYDNTAVTAYFRSPDAPLTFHQFKNVPDLGQKYHGFELALKKRFSHNWQLTGSVVFSKATGNLGLGYLSSSGFSPAANSPNDFVNVSKQSRLDFDRPIIIKLAGTYRFPYQFFLSFFYMHMSGAPWARQVTVFMPSSSSSSESSAMIPATVYLESPGERRSKAFDNLDIRIEKEFALSRSAKIGLLLDVFNALGNEYQNLFQNDGGYWFPAGENTTEGNRIVSPNYKKVIFLSGVRSFRLGLQIHF
jgi:hypothetical protein